MALEKISDSAPKVHPKCADCKSEVLIDNYKYDDIDFLTMFTCVKCGKTKLLKMKSDLTYIKF